MIIALNVGSKCALMLPRDFINPQLTPAKGMVINKLVDSRHLVLVEEVWQFKGVTPQKPTKEMCFSTGDIKHSNWGWKEIPELVEDDSYIILPTFPHNLMEPKIDTIEAMIKRSIRDFKSVHGFV